MGLDGVELIVEVENAFEIQILDEEAGRIATVGDFYEVVWNKIKDKKSNKCASAMLFYRLRKLMVEKCEISVRDFKLDKNLNDLISKDTRKEKWKELQSKFEFKLPDLTLPNVLQLFELYLGLVLILGSLIFSFIAVMFFHLSNLLFLLPVLGILIIVVLSIALKPLKTDISQSNIREFIENVLTINYKEIQLKFGTNRTEMEKVMNNIIHDKIGVDFEEIKPGAHLVNDLGID